MVHLNSSLGSGNLFTDCLPRLPSHPHLSCSPCTARWRTSSSTTPGPVINRDCTSSRLPLLPPCHRWSSGLITRPVSTATSLWNLWRPSSCRRVNVCQKVMHLRLQPWPLCGDWSPLHHQALGQSAVPPRRGGPTPHWVKCFCLSSISPEWRLCGIVMSG